MFSGRSPNSIGKFTRIFWRVPRKVERSLLRQGKGVTANAKLTLGQLIFQLKAGQGVLASMGVCLSSDQQDVQHALQVESHRQQ
jgi:hypothetical protein